MSRRGDPANVGGLAKGGGLRGRRGQRQNQPTSPMTPMSPESHPTNKKAPRPKAEGLSKETGLDSLKLLGFLHNVVQTTAVEERLLGNVVEVAIDDLLERADRLVDLNVSARGTGELLGNEVRLR